MRKYRANTPEDITPYHARNIRAGNYLEDPRDGPMWDAGIARYNRSLTYSDRRGSLRDTLRWIMFAALITVFAVAMYQGGVW
jgi:hypothetical protein